MKWCSFVVVLVILCSGCSQKQYEVLKQHDFEIYAKHGNLPELPLYAQKVTVETFDDNDVIVVRFVLSTEYASLNDLQLWYLQELERQGWSVETYTNLDTDLMIVAKNPKSWAFVLCSYKNKSSIEGKVIKQII